IGVNAESDLAASSDQDHLRLPIGSVGQYIGTPPQTGRRRIATAIQRGEWLASQHQAGRLMLEWNNDAPSLDDLVGIGWPQCDETRDAAQGDELLDRLVRRPIFADAD